MNGKENPAVSFTNFTAHQIKKYLEHNSKELLTNYLVDKFDRSYQFWKRHPLAIPLSTIKILEQKLDYIHNNPIVKKSALAPLPEEYRWRSANFYFNGIDEFGILTHYKQ